MKKDSIYFSHDANARHDPNICEMRAEYGLEGYGLYWCIIEMLREQENYKLELKRINAIAMQTHCEIELIERFIKDCCEEFDLFESDGKDFWSWSLLRRMEIKDSKSEKARKSAEARWGKNANAMRTQSKGNAIKERKGKKRKVKKKKLKRKRLGKYKHVLFTKPQYDKLLSKWGQLKLDHMIKVLDEGIELKGYKYQNHNLAIQQWAKKESNIPVSESNEYEIVDLDEKWSESDAT